MDYQVYELLKTLEKEIKDILSHLIWSQQYDFTGLNFSS